jgi:two-component system sensor histidine kinase TctE
MGLSALLVWWGVGRGLRPLLSLRDEVISRSSLDLHPLPEQENIPEVRPLIHSFNELMAQMEISLAAQQRFITNAAHQLRTPLSGFKTQAELIMRMDNVDEIHYKMQQLHIAADQAGRMISQLLVLASSEPGAQTPERFSTLNLVAMARGITESWVPHARKRQIDLGFESDESIVEVTGNALLMGEMLGNLIDNALRYSHYSGRVTVRISRKEQLVYLAVEDDGPGITECERERIFERFYRVPGTLQDGCGLGLAIVREIAHRHQAEVEALPALNGRGTLMRITFSLNGAQGLNAGQI